MFGVVGNCHFKYVGAGNCPPGIDKIQVIYEPKNERTKLDEIETVYSLPFNCFIKPLSF